MLISIVNKHIGEGHPCFIIAEVAKAHDGSLGMAHAYIDADLCVFNRVFGIRPMLCQRG